MTNCELEIRQLQDWAKMILKKTTIMLEMLRQVDGQANQAFIDAEWKKMKGSVAVEFARWIVARGVSE